MSARPLPAPTGDTAPFWKACREGRLSLPRCADCGHLNFYPRRHCVRCLSLDLAWEDLCGRGVVYTYSTVYRALSPAFKDQVPYIVAAVDLDEGPRLMTRLVDCAPADVRIGLRVEVTFLRESADIALP